MDTYLRYMYKYKDKTKIQIQIHWLFEQYFTVIYRRDQWRRRGRCRFWNHYHFSKVNDKVSKTEGLPGKYPTLSVPHLPLWSHLPSFCLIIILWIFKGGRRGTASALQLGCAWMWVMWWGWTGSRDWSAWHRRQSLLKSLRSTYGILESGHIFWTQFRDYQRLGQCMFLSKLKWQLDLLRCLDIATLVVTEENLELALQVFAMSHRLQVLDFGLGLNPSRLQWYDEKHEN